MRIRTTLLYSVAITSLLSVLGSEPGGRTPSPVSPDASPEAKALLRVLHDISGKHTLTGQHNYPNTKDTYTLRTAQVCGKVPAVFGQDFGFAAPGNQDAAAARPDIIAEIKRRGSADASPRIISQAPTILTQRPWMFIRATSSRVITRACSTWQQASRWRWLRWGRHPRWRCWRNSPAGPGG